MPPGTCRWGPSDKPGPSATVAIIELPLWLIMILLAVGIPVVLLRERRDTERDTERSENYRQRAQEIRTEEVEGD